MRRAGQLILDQGRQAVEPGQQTRADKSRQGSGYAKPGHDPPIGLPEHQAKLEEVVGEMHDRRGRDGQRRRKE
jgi:hypothetical protein